jgi:NADPH:quinone reductase-like Zn-dependent oxidoreductase
LRMTAIAGAMCLAQAMMSTHAASGASMQAAVVTGARVSIQTVPRPVPAADEVLVRLQFASVNPADWRRANGKPEDLSIGKPREGHPAIPGLDGAGTVAALGRGVRGFKVGDAVLLWSVHGGTYAQYVAVAARDLARMPAGLPMAQAAAIPHAGLAAWSLLVQVARIHAGQNVLVLGGAGGVGSAAVQIARIQGAHVIATASARNADYLHGLGVDTVIDYNTAHFEEQVRNVDVVVNAVDADNAYRGLAVVKRGGYLLSVAGLPTAAQCAGRAVICVARDPATTAARDGLEQLAGWAADDRFIVNIERTFELKDVLQAWGYSQAGHTRGKAVIHIVDKL